MSSTFRPVHKQEIAGKQWAIQASLNVGAVVALSVGWLCVFASLAQAGGPTPPSALAYDWSADFHPPGSSGKIRASAVYDDGNGPALYVAGDFLTIDNIEARYIAKWDGTSWSALGAGIKGNIRALIPFDEGDGPLLYVGGRGGLGIVGGEIVGSIARWDGTFWSDLNGGSPLGTILAMAPFDEAMGQALFDGGGFRYLENGRVAGYIAKYGLEDVSLFIDGFESGDLSRWSATDP